MALRRAARDLMGWRTPLADDFLLTVLAASIVAIALLAYPGRRMLVNLVRAIARVVGRVAGK